jgi:GTP diphosphokinase / guanosine-3',5'-bis(diphosphate) 3'-diphosphatase
VLGLIWLLNGGRIRTMSRLDKAIQLAVETHSGQNDLGGNQYILHPLRVMLSVEKTIRKDDVKDRESILCSAVMHDCIEDSKFPTITEELIKQEFGPIVFKTVNTLTRRKGMSWKKYIKAVNEHWAPRTIKIADLIDNLDTDRLNRDEATEKDLVRFKMYNQALLELKYIGVSK